MKKMKLTIVLLLVTFAVAFCQPDKVFKEQITVEKGIKYGDGTIQLTAGGGGSMVYPSAGIPLSTGTAWGTSITNNSANWNTAYSWGNHANLYSLLNHNHSTLYKAIGYVPTWAEITSKPSTFPSTWATVSGKPTFATVATSGSYVDLSDKPAEIELQAAISSLNVLVIPKKTTTEIAAMTPTAGSFVYDVTLNVLKIGNGSVFKVLITAN